VVKYVDGDQAVRDTYGQFINDWCIDAVTSLGYIFHSLGTFNEPLSGWNVSGVTSMEGMVRNVAFHLCVCVFSPSSHARRECNNSHIVTVITTTNSSATLQHLINRLAIGM
jgi:Mycoplasma protein of unknown function, DUF285